MQPKNIHNLFNDFIDDHLCFVYRGSFSNKTVTNLTNLVVGSLDDVSGFVSLRNRLSFLMIESIQNIAKHGDKSEDKSGGEGFFLTRNVGNTFFITTANVMEGENVSALREILEKVNTAADKNELKNLYVTVLTDKKISDKGGAGLGLIEMARKTEQKLEFDFVPLDEKNSLFYLQLRIMNKKALENPDVEPSIPISVARNFYERSCKDDFVMLHRGSFSEDVIFPVLNMVEHDMLRHALSIQKKMFFVLVELLQNISKHSYIKNGEREGIFVMGQRTNQYILATGNYIHNSEVELLKNQLVQINGVEKAQLKDLYRELLREETETISENAGLGLIDIARESKEKLLFDFYPVNSEISFFSIVTTL